MKIIAVVVTYNRIEYLKKCILALKNQTLQLNEILVVNNGSTDGTRQWLENEDGITVINQENLGGAGGFYTGIKYAYEKGYDWIWCVDDDCMPKYDCLKKQFTGDKNIISNPRIVNENNFDLYDYNKLLKKKFYHHIYDKLKMPYINLSFCGLLISNLVVEKIGLPMKELFVYGDDLEYTFRAQKFGFKVEIVLDAILIHPSLKSLSSYSEQSLFFYFRNVFFVLNKYSFMKIRALKFLINTIKFCIFSKKKLRIALRSIYSGLTGNFIR